MIRARILQDSKQLACLLLKESKSYSQAKQLGLDMLSRLGLQVDEALIEKLSLTSDPSPV